MAKINELVEQVVRKETALLQEKVAKRRTETKQALEAKQVELKERLVLEQAKVDADLKASYQITHQSQNIAHRDQLLREKQRLLQEVFAEAQDELDQLAPEQLQTFLSSILKQFENQGELTVILGELSEGKIDQAWLNQVTVPGVQLKLAPETIQQQGGFVIERGGIQYNFLNNSLIQDAKAKMTVEIARLFNQ